MSATSSFPPYGVEFWTDGVAVHTAWLTSSDPVWQCALTRMPHDVYHTPEYAALSASDGIVVAFHATTDDSELLVPLVVRDVPRASGWKDAASPYGYPGPLVNGPRAALLWRAFEHACRAAHVVCVFLRLHPTLNADTANLPGTVVHHGDTYFVDLTLPDEAYLRVLRDDHRRRARRLSKAGYTAVMNDWSHFDAFQDVYVRTMRRVGASEFYFFGAEHFRSVRAALGDRAHLCSVLGPQGDVAAGGLLLTCGRFVQFHLSGVADAHVRASPTRLLDVYARSYFHERGFEWLHLGGGLGGRDDSLARYKAGLATHRAPFHTARLVTMPDAYASLCRSAPASTFFPAYRAPSATLASCTARGA